MTERDRDDNDVEERFKGQEKNLIQGKFPLALFFKGGS
jgi:hypothetical protein